MAKLDENLAIETLGGGPVSLQYVATQRDSQEPADSLYIINTALNPDCCMHRVCMCVHAHTCPAAHTHTRTHIHTHTHTP